MQSHDKIIIVRNLSKSYRTYTSRLRRVVNWLIPIVHAPFTQRTVLHDISFDIDQGEAVGLVGMNGAGKSTLLKILAGTSYASAGSFDLKGSVAGLLELGMGFNHDFTGIQNAIMGLEILGHDPKANPELLHDILNFSELGEFFHQPLRVYSSGMSMRLAFSVATAVRPDVLIVDEALSVGDAYFQHKSFDRIRQFKRQGSTLLMVSHDRGAIQSICDKAIFLHDGAIVEIGQPDRIFDLYNAMLADREALTIKTNQTTDGKAQTVSGNRKAHIVDSQLIEQASGLPCETLKTGADVSLRYRIQINEDLDTLVLGYCIKDRFGQDVFGTNTFHHNQVLKELKAGQKLEANFDFPVRIGPGTYSVTVALTASEDHLQENYFWKDLDLIFNVINPDTPYFVGTNWLPPKSLNIREVHE